MRVAALGRTRWLYNTIRALSAGGLEIVLIGTCAASPEYEVREEHFAQLASDLGAAFFVDANLSNPTPKALLARCGADVGVSVNWLTLLDDDVLGRFPHGVLNGHPGDLPRYRGNAAPNWAIIAGEHEVVATVHRMTAELDAGPVLCRRSLPLDDSTYIADVYAMLDTAFPELFLEAVDGLASGRLVEQPQPAEPGLSLRGFPRLPRDSELDWSRAAEELARLVRASSEPFAGAFSYLDLNRLVVWRAHAEDIPFPWLGAPGQVIDVRQSTGDVAVLTGAGALILEQIEIDSQGRRAPAELIRSTRTRLGLDVGAAIEASTARIAQLEARLREPAGTDADRPAAT